MGHGFRDWEGTLSSGWSAERGSSPWWEGVMERNQAAHGRAETETERLRSHSRVYPSLTVYPSLRSVPTASLTVYPSLTGVHTVSFMVYPSLIHGVSSLTHGCTSASLMGAPESHPCVYHSLTHGVPQSHSWVYPKQPGDILLGPTFKGSTTVRQGLMCLKFQPWGNWARESRIPGWPRA